MKSWKKSAGVMVVLMLAAAVVIACPSKKQHSVMAADSISGASLWSYISSDSP
ncbi:MAG: hypothetical protein R6V10_00480 [bacterium]